MQNHIVLLFRSVRGGATVWLVVPAVLAAFVLGCEQRGVEEHTVDKGAERIGAAAEPEDVEPEAAEPGRDTKADKPEHRWDTPEGWTLDPAPRPMRLATLMVDDPTGPVEVAVSRFPGRVGGELANVNRWRGQLGLTPIMQNELDETLTRFASPGFEGYQTRIESPAGVMLAAGVYEAAIDQTWFVRATVADAATADRIQADLFVMARSIARPTDGGKE